MDAFALAGIATITVQAIYSGARNAIEAPSVSIPKAEEKEADIALPSSPPELTVIYRYGGTNPGNLTPREKNESTGLSFSTIPRPGAAMTTIEVLNATGIVYAIQDKQNHVAVWPVGGTMHDWTSIGSMSI